MLHLKWVFDALAIIILATIMLAHRPDRPAEILLLALAATMLVRFVAYPTTEIRHYSPALFGICLIVLRAGASFVPMDRSRLSSLPCWSARDAGSQGTFAGCSSWRNARHTCRPA